MTGDPRSLLVMSAVKVMNVNVVETEKRTDYSGAYTVSYSTLYVIFYRHVDSPMWLMLF